MAVVATITLFSGFDASGTITELTLLVLKRVLLVLAVLLLEGCLATLFIEQLLRPWQHLLIGSSIPTRLGVIGNGL